MFGLFRRRNREVLHEPADGLTTAQRQQQLTNEGRLTLGDSSADAAVWRADIDETDETDDARDFDEVELDDVDEDDL